jgi:hypothetical protein
VAAILLVIVDDLNIFRSFRGPDETHAPLVVDADAVLPLALPFQRFQSITRGRSQIFQDQRPIQLLKLAKGRSLDVDPPLDPLAKEKRLRFSATEALDCQGRTLTPRVAKVNTTTIRQDQVVGPPLFAEAIERLPAALVGECYVTLPHGATTVGCSGGSASDVALVVMSSVLARRAVRLR